MREFKRHKSSNIEIQGQRDSNLETKPQIPHFMHKKVGDYINSMNLDEYRRFIENVKYNIEIESRKNTAEMENGEILSRFIRQRQATQNIYQGALTYLIGLRNPESVDDMRINIRNIFTNENRALKYTAEFYLNNKGEDRTTSVQIEQSGSSRTLDMSTHLNRHNDGKGTIDAIDKIKALDMTRLDCIRNLISSAKYYW